MSEEIATADANVREIARLRVENRLLRNRPAVEAELVERGAELIVVLADAPADLVRATAPDTLRAVLAEVVRLREAQHGSAQTIIELIGELRAWQQAFGKPGTVAHQRADIIIRDAVADAAIDTEIDRILSMPDDQILAEARAEGRDPDAEAREMAAQFRVIARLSADRDRLRARIDRAASHLPGRPDVAEQILSEE